MRPTLLALLLLAPLAASAQSVDRGRLLYANHCIECHATQMHWREGRLARDWDGLRAQVTRWQGNARLQWSAEDIQAVTHYLNETIYRFPRTQAALPPSARPASF